MLRLHVILHCPPSRCYTDVQAYEQFNIVQSPQVGFVDGRRACVLGGCAGHLPRRSDGVVRRDGVGGRAVGYSSPDAQKDILCDTLSAICSSGLFLWCVWSAGNRIGD